MGPGLRNVPFAALLLGVALEGCGGGYSPPTQPPPPTLAQLHRILQMVMGWENYHLYEFRIGGRIYGDPDLDDEREIIDAKKTRIRNILPGVGAEFEYEYDFGDDWQHDLLLEAVMQSGPDTMCPRCLAGERSCPPEDVGGSGGYADYLEVLADPDHEEHQNMMEWRGPFDPETFSVESVNRELEKKFRSVRKKAIRLPSPKPKAADPGIATSELLLQAILSRPDWSPTANPYQTERDGPPGIE